MNAMRHFFKAHKDCSWELENGNVEKKHGKEWRRREEQTGNRRKSKQRCMGEARTHI